MVYRNAMGMLTGEYNGSGTSALSYTLIAAADATSSKRSSYTASNNYNIVTDHFTWEQNEFSWYTDGSNSPDGRIQLNALGTKYYYLAIG